METRKFFRATPSPLGRARHDEVVEVARARSSRAGSRRGSPRRSRGRARLPLVRLQLPTRSRNLAIEEASSSPSKCRPARASQRWAPLGARSSRRRATAIARGPGAPSHRAPGKGGTTARGARRGLGTAGRRRPGCRRWARRRPPAPPGPGPPDGLRGVGLADELADHLVAHVVEPLARIEALIAKSALRTTPRGGSPKPSRSAAAWSAPSRPAARAAGSRVLAEQRLEHLVGARADARGRAGRRHP